MNNKKKWLPVLAVVALVLIVGFVSLNQNKVNAVDTNIGIITDLTGPAAYWGESTRVGAEIAKNELEQQGYKVNLIFEDYQLDAGKALSAAQKLVNSNEIDAIYAEFNPAAISAGSFLKDKNVLFVYDAAVTSPLSGNDNAYKTYLDYQAGCREVAQRFKDQGVEKIGVLKINMEAGELCLDGVEEVFPQNLLVESYNLGETNLNTQVLKLRSGGVQAVINAAFEGDTLNTLKAFKELGFAVPYGTVDDSVTENVVTLYANELKGAWTFGFNDVDTGFVSSLQQASSKKLATDYAAALAYTHVKQIVKAFDLCEKDLECVRKEMSASPSDNTIGFRKFENNVADLQMNIKQY